METNEARIALAQAEQLQANSRRAGGWLATFYLVMGVATVVMATLLVLAAGGVGVAVSTLFWVIAMTGISIYANRQKTAMRGTGRIHAVVIGLWTIGWLIAVTGMTDVTRYLTGVAICVVACFGGALYVFLKVRR